MKNQFAHIETVVKSIIPKRSTLPILENVALKNDHIFVTDLETSASIPFQCGINVCIGMQDFLNSLKKENPKYVLGKKNQVAINSGVRVTGESLDEFPVEPKAESKFSFFTKEAIETMSKATAFCSTDSLRPSMQGVLVSKDHIVSTDGHRLFFKKHSLKLKESVIIPVKVIKLLARLDKDFEVFGLCETKKWNEHESIWTPEEMKIHKERAQKFYDLRRKEENISERYIQLSRIEDLADEIVGMEKIVPQKAKVWTHLRFVSVDGIEITSRLIEEKYSNWKAVIPSNEDTKHTATVSMKKFMDVVKEASQYSNSRTRQVKLSVNGAITISAQDVDFGKKFSKRISCKHSGEGKIDIGFNASYLLQLSSVLNLENLTMQISESNKPVIFNDETLVMPVRLTN